MTSLRAITLKTLKALSKTKVAAARTSLRATSLTMTIRKK